MRAVVVADDLLSSRNIHISCTSDCRHSISYSIIAIIVNTTLIVSTADSKARYTVELVYNRRSSDDPRVNTISQAANGADRETCKHIICLTCVPIQICCGVAGIVACI